MRGVAIGACGLILLTTPWSWGCGSGSNSPASKPLLQTLPGVAPLDGYVDTSGAAVSNAGGPWTGDIDFVTAGRGARQFFSFDLSLLPAGATILDAQLQLDQVVVFGSPYATHGVVALDHLDYGATLDAADFNAAALATVGVLSADATIGIKMLDVTASVQADVAAARAYSQFRAYFTLQDSDNDNADDYALFLDSEHSNFATGEIPRLVIQYLP
jgi:hypothetical protein